MAKPVQTARTRFTAALPLSRSGALAHRRAVLLGASLCAALTMASSGGPAASPSHAPASSRAASTLIRGGMVIDGTGRPRRRADIRIVGTDIRAVGTLRPRPGEQVLDARGLVVSPGFIDTHSHVDGGLLQDPLAEAPLRQGITTSCVGQDGSSHFPLKNWLAQVEAAHVAINIASFVGHGTVREEVLHGDYKHPTTPEQRARMAALVDQEMRSGALGLSSGLEYDPGYYSDTAELVACARPAAAHHGIYISHVRDEGDKVFPAFRELIQIGREAHLPAQISHIKLDTRPVWGKAGQALALMQAARQSGHSVTADVYPYLFWQSTIIVLIPTRNWDDRTAWQKGLAEVGGPSHVRLTTYTPDPSWAGRTIAEIAARTGKDPVTVIQEVVRNTHGPKATGHEGVVVTAMTEADLAKFIASPWIMFCTDGGLRGSHPRAAGSFPRVLARYVRDQHLLRLEEAIRKMTSLPAWRMGFHDRGVIRPGMKADLVIFNPATIRDTATIEHPMSPPVGIRYVLVNGVPVTDNGRMTGARPGEVIRHAG